MVLLRDHSRVVEVIEHQVHVLLSLGRQVGAVQVTVVFVDRDADTSCRNVTGGS